MLCKTFDIFSYGMGYIHTCIFYAFFLCCCDGNIFQQMHMRMSIAAEGDNSIHFIKCETTLSPAHFNL